MKLSTTSFNNHVVGSPSSIEHGTKPCYSYRQATRMSCLLCLQPGTQHLNGIEPRRASDLLACLAFCMVLADDRRLRTIWGTTETNVT